MKKIQHAARGLMNVFHSLYLYIIIIIMCIPYITIVNERAKKEKKRCLPSSPFYLFDTVHCSMYVYQLILYYRAWTNIDALSSSTSVAYTKDFEDESFLYARCSTTFFISCCFIDVGCHKLENR